MSLKSVSSYLSMIWRILVRKHKDGQLEDQILSTEEEFVPIPVILPEIRIILIIMPTKSRKLRKRLP